MTRTKRWEYKFYISRWDYLHLRGRLRAIAKPDPYVTQDGTYTVRSLYFDNTTNDAYYEKLNGCAVRKKLRLRIYNDSLEPIKIELKKKNGDLIEKISERIDKKTAVSLIRSSATALDISSLSDELKYTIGSDCWRPKVLVQYTREPFIFDLNNVRINFDLNVIKEEQQLDLFGSNIPWTPADTEKIILEIKFDHFLPRSIAGLLTFSNSHRLAISKYCLSRSLIY